MTSNRVPAFVWLLVVAACASAPPLVGGGEIRNESRAVITDVRAVHEPTRRVVAANQILPGAALQLGFSPREMKATHAELTWTVGGRACSARLAAPACPPELEGKPVWIVYRIRADGTATVEARPMPE